MPRRAADPHAQALSYGDVVLRVADVQLLEEPTCWLNDQVIAFFFEYVAADKHKKLFDAGRVLLLPPAMTFLLATAGPDVAPAIMEPLQAQDKDLVLFAVNDNPDVEAAAGGSHWSLLVYSRDVCMFRHYDSAPSASSSSAAARVYQAVRDTLAPPGKACPLQNVSRMPHQQNGHDCGVYVLAAVDAICEATFLEQGPPVRAKIDVDALEARLKELLTPKAVVDFRSYLMRVVHGLQQREQT